jgi:hypothetical protein
MSIDWRRSPYELRLLADLERTSHCRFGVIEGSCPPSAARLSAALRASGGSVWREHLVGHLARASGGSIWYGIWRGHLTRASGTSIWKGIRWEHLIGASSKIICREHLIRARHGI